MPSSGSTKGATGIDSFTPAAESSSGCGEMEWREK